MSKWPLIVAGLYGLVFSILFVPLFWLAFLGNPEDFGNLLPELGYYVGVLVMNMVLAQFALLQVPVAVASRRPVSRRSLLSTAIAAGFMMCLLVIGAGCCINEFFTQLEGGELWVLIPIAVGVGSWLFWSIYFYLCTKRVQAGKGVTRLQRFLWTGSILELLIAVPTHVIARNRDYCCAGYLTFIGLTCGLSVMLFAFGPAVYFLFVERWRRLHPGPGTQ